MPYAVIDLADGNKVVMVVSQKWRPVAIEEEWLDENDEKPQPPTGYSEDFREVLLTKDESLKIAAAMESGDKVCVGASGWAYLGEGESQESFWLKEFELENLFLGQVLDLALYAAGKISKEQYQECRYLRDQMINKVMAQ